MTMSMPNGRAGPDAGGGDRDWFYVGYLAMPRRLGGFLRVAVPVMLWLMVIVNGLAVWRLRSGGDGLWDLSAPVRLVGTARLLPYPTVTVDEGEHAGVWLVVEELKRGGQERLAGFDGRRVEISGYTLERGGQRMLTLPPTGGIAAVEELAPPAGDLALPGRPGFASTGERVTLVGEIVDAKCYLGAMRPGEGTAHSPCARLCLLGGIPAFLVCETEDGVRHVYLLVGEGGGMIDAATIDAVGRPVRIEGRLGSLGEQVSTLRVSAVEVAG